MKGYTDITLTGEPARKLKDIHRRSFLKYVVGATVAIPSLIGASKSLKVQFRFRGFNFEPQKKTIEIKYEIKTGWTWHKRTKTIPMDSKFAKRLLQMNMADWEDCNRINLEIIK